MKKSLPKALFIAPILFLATAVCGSELSGQWTLTVKNPDHVAVATLKVEFTDKQAPSCAGGNWKVVEVVSASTREEDFFPVSEPLSYRIENNQLTIGRNQLCDAYLRLRGPLSSPFISGDYFSWGRGGEGPLGYFDLLRVR